MKNRAPLLAVVLLSILACPGFAGEPAYKSADVAEFEKLAKEPGVVLLDVRSPNEYQAGHLKDAVLINYNAKDFDEQVKQLDKTKTYLVYCAVGGRSAKACDKLGKLEFTHLTNLTGGIKAWERAGKAVEK